jgi:hypothetical protein
VAERAAAVAWRGEFEVRDVIAAGVGLLLLSAVLAAMAALVGHGQLGRNDMVGVRTRSTLHCDECWEAGHRACLPSLRRAVVAGSVAGVVCFGLAWVVPEQSRGELVAMILAGSGYVGVVGLVVQSALCASRAARRVHPR